MCCRSGKADGIGDVGLKPQRRPTGRAGPSASRRSPRARVTTTRVVDGTADRSQATTIGINRQSALCHTFDTALKFRSSRHARPHNFQAFRHHNHSRLRSRPGGADRGGRAGDATKFPDHPIRVIVSTLAGGGVDIFARLVTLKMGAELGQPFAVRTRAAPAAASAPMRLSFRTRRLHSARLAAGTDHHQSIPLQVTQLRPNAIRTCRHHVAYSERPDGATRFPRQDGAGADRLRQGQSEQAQLRLAGRRHHVAPDR